MKKILLLFALLVIAVPKMNAQVRTDYQTNQPEFTSAQNIEWNTRYTMLLDNQNKLLQNRKTAIIISLAGGAVGVVGTTMVSVSSLSGETSPSGSALTLIGGAATAVGGVWLIVNEFKLINNQTQINDHLKLRLTPGGVALEF